MYFEKRKKWRDDDKKQIEYYQKIKESIESRKNEKKVLEEIKEFLNESKFDVFTEIRIFKILELLMEFKYSLKLINYFFSIEEYFESFFTENDRIITRRLPHFKNYIKIHSKNNEIILKGIRDNYYKDNKSISYNDFLKKIMNYDKKSWDLKLLFCFKFNMDILSIKKNIENENIKEEKKEKILIICLRNKTDDDIIKIILKKMEIVSELLLIPALKNKYDKKIITLILKKIKKIIFIDFIIRLIFNNIKQYGNEILKLLINKMEYICFDKFLRLAIKNKCDNKIIKNLIYKTQNFFQILKI